MKIVIVSYDLRVENLRLQPWRYVCEIAVGLAAAGHDVCIMTDAQFSREHDLSVVSIIPNVLLSPFAVNDIKQRISESKPDIVLWPFGAKSLGYRSLFQCLSVPIVCYLPGPVLSMKELALFLKTGMVRESMSAFAWVCAEILGLYRWARKHVSGFVAFSRATQKTLVSKGCDQKRVQYFAGGKTLDVVAQKNAASGKAAHFLFMGWPSTIRGTRVLLDAFRVAQHKVPQITLTILARGAKTADHQRLYKQVKSHPAASNISIVEGFLQPEVVDEYIASCTYGVLPFIHAPAERPLSILEFFSQGKPVLTTDVPGLPELVGDDERGFIAGRGDAGHLARAMITAAEQADEGYQTQSLACRHYMDTYPTWQESVKELNAFLDQYAGEKGQ